MTGDVYADGFNPDLLERIPLRARLVLDVGCGAGALGAAFRRRNPQAEVIGIEIDRSRAEIAATRLDRVFCGDIEDNPFPSDLEGRVDCLVLGDVLEHLRDPWRFLARTRPLLAPEGVVLASVPNVEHWSLVLRLLKGEWRYEESGLFDRTHLRWFSARTLIEAFREAGYQPLDISPRIFEAEQGQRMLALLKPALEALGIEAQDYARRALPLQYVVRALPELPARLQVLSTMLAPVGGVSHVRVIEPMRALAAEPAIIARLTDLRDLDAIDRALPRILILHRPALLGARGLAVIRGLRARGFVIVCEFDDHPDYIPILQNPEMYNFTAVHAVQTTTPALAEVLKSANPEIAVFPNAIAELPEPRNFRPDAPLTFFFGGINREEDWPPFIEAINEAAASCGDRLRFVVVHDRGFFEALASPHKEFHPMLDYDRYRAKLAEAEICFMPLRDTPFNRCKSDLKFIEASAFRVAALASDVVYEGVIRDGETGMIFHTPDELEAKLKALVAAPERARAMADAARAYVAAERMLAGQIAPRIAWYRALWARREALDAALLARHPELAAEAPSPAG
jgi:SAM-dependent methyltransferase/glycosyltransferase involved in cell wall biosynthesis